jgi:predicted HD phosphohydrolase
MKPDKFRRRFRAPRADDRLRRQIATEAARRLLASGPAEAILESAGEGDFYAAKRRAAAVLGHAVRPGDLPSDEEVRAQVRALSREPGSLVEQPPEPAGDALPHISEHLDRFAIYRLRLAPLEAVKQDPRFHPEGDALYHSLQVFERAREVRPYDEEFLLAALLHDVGKAIDPHDHVRAGLIALQGTIPERTAWLIEHHQDLMERPNRPVSPRLRRALMESEFYDDLVLLREADDAGRAVGVQVGTIDEALAYLRGLEGEAYLDRDATPSDRSP